MTANSFQPICPLFAIISHESSPCCNTTTSETQEEHWNQIRGFKQECEKELNGDFFYQNLDIATLTNFD